MSWSILLYCVFDSLTFSLLTVELIRRRNSFCWFDKRSASGLCIRWFFLFLVESIVFVAASVELARILCHDYRDSRVITVGRHFGFFLIYKLEDVIALVVCFVYIFEDAIFFYLQFADDEAMITSCFCSAETSGIDESVFDFLEEYVVELFIHCYCFRQIFGMNSFLFPCSYLGSFVLKGYVADENVVDCKEIDEMLSLFFEQHEQNFQYWDVAGSFSLLFFFLISFTLAIK